MKKLALAALFALITFITPTVAGDYTHVHFFVPMNVQYNQGWSANTGIAFAYYPNWNGERNYFWHKPSTPIFQFTIGKGNVEGGTFNQRVCFNSRWPQPNCRTMEFTAPSRSTTTYGFGMLIYLH